ncbi:hypothetical protein ACLMJK_009404 [Lecanora helva]
MTFGVFRNEHRNAEFAIQVVRDTNSLTRTPEKRPEHSVHEGLEPRPLFCNPILTTLARAIADDASRNYRTVEELIDIEPPEDEMYQLRQRDDIFDKPFLHVISTREINKVDMFSRRLRELGTCAGYLRSPTIYDFRAEGLYLVVQNELYSTTQKMEHGGHRDERTFGDSYIPNDVGVDLQGDYFDGKIRSIANDRFRGLTLHCNPQLWRTLRARNQYKLGSSLKFSALEGEIDALVAKTPPQRNLQPSKRLARPEDAELMGYNHSQFHRVRRLMPERDRLASNFFLVAPIRSEEGRSVFQDIIALCQQDAKVPFRPGLEPERCSYSIVSRNLELDRYVVSSPLPLTTDQAVNYLPQQTGRREMETHLHLL